MSIVHALDRAPARVLGGLLGTLLAAAGCGGDRGSTPVEPASTVVRPPAVADLTIDWGAEGDTVWVGRSATLRAHALAADGTRLAGRLVTWSTVDSAMVALESQGDGAVRVRGRQTGAARLVVTSEGVSQVVTLRGLPIPVATLALVGVPDTLDAGGRAVVRVVATARDGVGLTEDERAGRAIVWESADPAVVQVRVASGAPAGSAATDAGLATEAGGGATIEAQGAGRTVVRARLDDRVVEATVVVARPASTPVLPVEPAAPAAAAPAAPRVFPTAITAAPGATGRLTALASPGELGADGDRPTLGSDESVVWRTTDSTVVTVDETGRVTMRGVGRAEVLAVTAGGAVGRSSVTVLPAPARRFRIDVRGVGAVPDEVLAAAQRAAERWERVVVGALPPQPVALAADACDEGTPAVHETVRDVVVFLRVAPIDGARGTLAYAGPCVVRRGGLPVLGVMVIDAADAPAASGEGGTFATDVIAHEIGHVLGLGTLWNGTGGAPALLEDPTGSDLRFAGASAVEAAARAGFTAPGVAVPVEQEGGEGTAGGHWRERDFRGELMTGWVNSAPNPLSIVTVGALRDLGFQVSETGADVVSPASAAGGAAFLASRRPADASRMTLTPHAERLVRPRWEVGADGRPTRARRR